jgi:malic enzyme
MSAETTISAFPKPDDPVFAMHRGGKLGMRATVDYGLPSLFDERVAPAVAAAVAAQARADEVARR